MFPRNNHTRHRILYYGSLILLIYTIIFLVMNTFVLVEELFHFVDRWDNSFEVLIYLYQLEIVYVAVEIVVVIVTILWMARSIANLNRSGIRTRYGPLAAGLGWLIPVVNLFVPYLVMREIIRKQWGLMAKFKPEPPTRIKPLDTVERRAGLWWGLWVCAFPFSYGLGFFFLEIAHDMDLFPWGEDLTRVIAQEGKMMFEIILLVVWVRLLRQMGWVEEENHRLGEAGTIDKYLEGKHPSPAADDQTEAIPPNWYDAQPTSAQP